MDLREKAAFVADHTLASSPFVDLYFAGFFSAVYVEKIAPSSVNVKSPSAPA